MLLHCGAHLGRPHERSTKLEKLFPSSEIKSLKNLVGGNHSQNCSIQCVFQKFNHAFIVSQTGQIYPIGKNHCAQLGLGHQKDIYKPFEEEIILPFLPSCQAPNIRLISCGYTHSFFVFEPCTISNNETIDGNNDDDNKNKNNYDDNNNHCIKSTNGGNEEDDDRNRQNLVGNQKSQYHLKDVPMFFGVGNNKHGQLGITDVNIELTTAMKPVEIPKCSDTKKSMFCSQDIKQIECGESFSTVLTFDGKIYVCGSNRLGELGIGYIETTSRQDVHKTHQTTKQGAVAIQHFFPQSSTCHLFITKIVCGYHHTCLITNDHKLYVYGSNDEGQLGIPVVPPSRNESNNPTSTISSDKKNIVPVAVQNDFFKNKIVRDVSCGSYHTIVLCDDGILYGFGYNKAGQLGMGHYEQKITTPIELKFCSSFQDDKIADIRCGICHTVIHTRQKDNLNDQVYTVGSNIEKQLGLSHDAPTFVSSFTSVGFQELSENDKRISAQWYIEGIFAGSFCTLILLKPKKWYFETFFTKNEQEHSLQTFADVLFTWYERY